jgi:hypothetical protein
MKKVQVTSSPQLRSLRSLEKVKGIADGGSLSSRSFKQNHPQLPILSENRVKIFESKLEDLTREASLMYHELSMLPRASSQSVGLPALPLPEENVKFKEYLDENTKIVLGAVTLNAITKKKLILPPHSCLPGRVDLCGKTLPALIELESKNQNVEILVAFNRYPTKQNYELKVSGCSALVPAKFINEITNNFSVRFLILSKDLVFCNAFARLANKTKEFYFLGQMKDGATNETPNYHDFIDIELSKPFRPIKIDVLKKTSSLIEQNMNSIYSHSKSNLAEKFKNTGVVLDGKIKSARLKKEIALELRRSHLLQSLKKHESAQQKAQTQLVNTVDHLLLKSVGRMWVQVLLTYRIFDSMVKMIRKKKTLMAMSEDMAKKTKIIQKKLRPILCWLIKDKNKANLEKVKQLIHFHNKVMHFPVYERALKVVGIGLKEFLRVIYIRNLIFNRVSYYIKIQNKWKDFLRNKQKAKMRYNKNLEQVYCRLIKLPEFFEKDMLRVTHHFTQACKDDVFDLFFNKRLMDYIQKKVDYLAERAMLVDVGLYYQELQDIPAIVEDEEVLLKERRKKTLQKHLNGIALAFFKAWLVCKSPSRVQQRIEVLKKKLTLAYSGPHVLPISLVKIKNFPTITSWLHSHNRYDLLALIKKNYNTHKYEGAAYRLGDLDATSPMSPQKRKVSKTLESTDDERERYRIIQQAKERSVGIRRIMNLLARDYTEKFEMEFTNELLVTIIMSSLEYFVQRYSASLKLSVSATE